MKKEATISACKKYRYTLSRIWDDSKPAVLFIMCNPSTADADVDDPTIRRCINFAKAWGFGALHVVNLFAFRSSKPGDLLDAEDPIGPDNIFHINEMVKVSNLIISAWGNSKIVEKLCKKFSSYKPFLGIKVSDLDYIELAKDGTPKHPLYLSADLKPSNTAVPNDLVHQFRMI